MGIIITDGYFTGYMDGTVGGKRLMWKGHSGLIKDFILKEKLKPFKLRLYMDKKRIKFPPHFPGIPAPHLHYKGEMFRLSQAKWRKFSNMIIKDLGKKLENIENVDMDRLSALSDTIRI